MRNFCRSSLLAFGLTLLVAVVALADEWPQFLGPGRHGISPEKNLVRSWKDGPKIAWRIPGGVGMSAVAVDKDLAFTMAHRKGKQTLIAIKAKTGDIAWETPVAPEYRNQMGDGTRATPAISDDRVIVFTGEGILAAIGRQDGKIVWSVDTLAEAKAEPADYGMASSPIVIDDKVIIHLGAAEAAVAAYNLKTGKRVWAHGNDPVGYSSPTILELHGEKQLVCFVGGSVMGLDPATGKPRWRYPFETDFGCNIATPIGVDGGVYISSGENHGGTLLDLEPSAGGFTAKERWTSFGPSSVLRSEWQTPIQIDGYLYGFDNVGGAGPVSHLTCIEAKTGKRAWQKQRFGKGNFIAADGVLYILTIEGQLVTVEVSPKAFTEISRAKLVGKTRTAPSLANGLLFVRDDKEIVCVDLRNE